MSSSINPGGRPNLPEPSGSPDLSQVRGSSNLNRRVKDTVEKPLGNIINTGAPSGARQYEPIEEDRRLSPRPAKDRPGESPLMDPSKSSPPLTEDETPEGSPK
ncbi:MAG: hypothetical protein JSS09_08220 [Verrucomicrobia bacterium]|nr:hypothetical protein [Verrucomicrobiota bacterium]